MSTVPLNFIIDAPNQQITIGTVVVPITNALASNIKWVEYLGGIGTITYNDRAPVPESFTDPSPYQPYINEWLTTYNGISNATFQTMVAVKSALIDAIWAVKRQAPVSVVTSLGTFSFDASDLTGVQAEGAYIANTVIPAINTLIGDITSINSDLVTLAAAIVTAVNGAFSTYRTADATALGQIVSTANTALSNIQSDINNFVGGTFVQNGITLVAGWPTTGIGASNITNIASPGVSESPPSAPTISLSYSGPTPPATLSGGSGAASFIPIGATSAPAFTTADQVAIASAAITQRNNAQLVRYQKQAALAALGTGVSVIAYDTTTGW